MVMVTVPGEAVCGVVEQCGERGVKAVTVLSAGFKELSKKSNELERRLMEVVRRYNMRLLGPNCMGASEMYLAFTRSTLGLPFQ